MANRQTNRRGGRAGNNGILRVIAVALALLAIAYVITSLALGGAWNPLKWTRKKSISGNERTSNDSVIMTEGESRGIVLTSMAIPVAEYAAYGVERAAESAQVVTANFTPAETTFQDVDYTLYFDTTSKPEYATWAAGKTVTDYATATQTEDGSRTATVAVKKSFSAPIMVKVTSRRDSSIFATFRLDYVCTTPHIQLYNASGLDDDNIWEVTWSDGTVAPYSESEVKVVIDLSLFARSMSEYGYTVDSTYSETLTFTDTGSADNNISSIKMILRAVGGEAAKNDATNYWNAACAALLGNYKPTGNDELTLGQYTIGYSRVYNGVTYSEYTVVEDYYDWYLLDARDLEVRATGMNITNASGEEITGLVFG